MSWLNLEAGQIQYAMNHDQAKQYQVYQMLSSCLCRQAQVGKENPKITSLASSHVAHGKLVEEDDMKSNMNPAEILTPHKYLPTVHPSYI